MSTLFLGVEYLIQTVLLYLFKVMACSMTCVLCNDKFDRYSGKLILVSDSLLDEIRPRVPHIEHHFVICADCLSKLLNRPYCIQDMKFRKLRQGRQWYTANLAWLAREQFRAGRITAKQFKEKIESLVSSEEKGGLQPKFIKG